MKHLLVIETASEIARQIPRSQVMKIRIKVDTDPPMGFDTENKFLLQPIPFSVRTFVLSDLFAGKMHAVLCRRWKSRVNGRDWYDLVWYAAHHPQLHLGHLEQRMIQSGHVKEGEPFVKNPEALEVWSKEFFQDVVKRVVLV